MYWKREKNSINSKLNRVLIKFSRINLKKSQKAKKHVRKEIVNTIKIKQGKIPIILTLNFLKGNI